MTLGNHSVAIMKNFVHCYMAMMNEPEKYRKKLEDYRPKYLWIRNLFKREGIIIPPQDETYWLDEELNVISEIFKVPEYKAD